MKTYYRFSPESSLYLGETPASGNPGALPPDNSTTIAPEITDGFWPFWTGSEWDYLEDHRGKTVWKTDLSGSGVIDAPGTIPDGFTDMMPLPLKEGYAVVWSDGEWAYLEAHIGEVGYVDGEQVTIAELGPLPDGWNTEPPPPPPYEPPPDTRTPEEKRLAAYRKEADPICHQIAGYRTEADALRLKGDEAGAAVADSKADALLMGYLAKKEEIRARYEDE